MRDKKRGIFNIILDIIIILLIILVIYWSIQLIFGGSPELSEFNFALIVLIGGFFIKIYREVGEIKIGLKHSFNKIKDDLHSIKEDINLIKNKTKRG